DLHDLQPEEARLAVCAALLDAMLLPAGALESPSYGLVVVTGRGGHSEGGKSVLQPAVLSLLEEELGLAAFVEPHNPGRVRVPCEELRGFVSGLPGATPAVLAKE
ncbi:unnamed protein product, partial [Polarella glacialis]